MQTLKNKFFSLTSKIVLPVVNFVRHHDPTESVFVNDLMNRIEWQYKIHAGIYKDVWQTREVQQSSSITDYERVVMESKSTESSVSVTQDKPSFINNADGTYSLVGPNITERDVTSTVQFLEKAGIDWNTEQIAKSLAYSLPFIVRTRHGQTFRCEPYKDTIGNYNAKLSPFFAVSKDKSGSSADELGMQKYK